MLEIIILARTQIEAENNLDSMDSFLAFQRLYRNEGMYIYMYKYNLYFT